MRSAGIRELRQRASELLRRVEAGESIEITDRGRPVALLTPIPADGALARLRASGDIAIADTTELPEPVDLPRGAEPASQVLERLRHGER